MKKISLLPLFILLSLTHVANGQEMKRMKDSDPLLESIGWMREGCTAVFVGERKALTARHCLGESWNPLIYPNQNHWLLTFSPTVNIKHTMDFNIQVGPSKIDLTMIILDEDPETRFPKLNIVKDGDQLTLAGYKNGSTSAYRSECLFKKEYALGRTPYHNYDCQSTPGVSGGAVFNQDAEVVGIHIGKDLKNVGRQIFVKFDQYIIDSITEHEAQ